MSMRARLFLAAVLILSSAALVLGKDLKTVILAPNGTHTIHVPHTDVLRIRNFTQQGGTTRGVVTVTIDSVPANVLAATVIDTGDPSTTTLEPVNTIVIAGRAMVTVTCPSDATSCVLSYRKGDDTDD